MSKFKLWLIIILALIALGLFRLEPVGHPFR